MKVLNYIVKGTHLLVVLACAALIVYITHETLLGRSFLADTRYLTFQFWVCLLFLFDILVEFIAAPRKWHYVRNNLFFILISIPYLNIIHFLKIEPSVQIQYLLHFIPMIRAGYVLAVVTGALTSSDRIKGLFLVYVLIMVSSIYFCSLIFYIEEHPVNPGVPNFWYAVYWAVLNSTTVGSNINSLTPTGQALDVVLSAEGLILFPLFTVYVTNILSRGKMAPAAVNTPDDSDDSTKADTDDKESGKTAAGTSEAPDSQTAVQTTA